MKKLLLILTLIVAGFVSHGQVKGYSVEATDYIILNEDTIRLSSPADGEYIGRISGIWTNTAGGSGTASIDSFEFNPGTGYIRWFIGGSAADSTSIDDRYVETEDSITEYVTPTQLADALVDIQTVVYSISLPINGTLAGSVAAAVEGTDYPTGWVLSASGVNLQVNHGLDRYVTTTNVFYNTTGVSYRQLRNFDNAYSGMLNVDKDNVTVEGLTNFYTAYKLNLYLILE